LTFGPWDWTEIQSAKSWCLKWPFTPNLVAIASVLFTRHAKTFRQTEEATALYRMGLDNEIEMMRE